jgi:pyruvate kinase
MIDAGMDVVRINFSHGTSEEHAKRVEMIRSLARAAGRTIGVLMDLQGPKIRIGKFENGKTVLKPGAKFILDAGCKLGNDDRVGLDYESLPQDVRPGDTLLLNDGLIVLTVVSVQGAQIHTIVDQGGVLSNNKGINRKGGGLSAPALTEKDMEDIRTAAELKADYLGVSFPRSGEDIEWARSLLHKAGGKALICAKIERAEAITALEEIIDASDVIMVARGDLAVEVGDAVIPALQKRMIRLSRARNKLVITATQMMESMIHSPVPTRAEVSDVANAVLDGTDAVMLSAETASGAYPVETVEAMARICIEAEKSAEVKLDQEFLTRVFTRIDQSIAMAALFTAHHLGCKAILALTESGSTALWMSRHKVHVPIYGLTSKVTSQRKMALYRNVRPLLMPNFTDRDQALACAEALLVEQGVLKPGDTYAITVGEPMGYPGGTNMLKVCRVA